jgi:pimeloyl-ACP methyl ester carboxylesterase
MSGRPQAWSATRGAGTQDAEGRPLLFLPGAAGAADFWKPAAEHLLSGRRRFFFSWPGLGAERPKAGFHGLADALGDVLQWMGEPVDLIAQSMGGLVAIRAALLAPDQVGRIVLAAVSGGLPVEDLGGTDWRDDYRRAFPMAAPWITEIREDLSALLPSITAPTLVLCGDADPISPPAVASRLADLIPGAALHVVRGGGHDFARTHAAEIRPVIAGHLA